MQKATALTVPSTRPVRSVATRKRRKNTAKKAHAGGASKKVRSLTPLQRAKQLRLARANVIERVILAESQLSRGKRKRAAPARKNPARPPEAAYFICARWSEPRNISAHTGKLVYWDGYGWTLNRKHALRVSHAVAVQLGKDAAKQNPGLQVAVCRNDERDAALLEQFSDARRSARAQERGFKARGF